jgi:penicillin-binding protein 1A
MTIALKDSPATEFRTPSGLRMYRVNPGTGLPAGAGETTAIWEGYKPGTEPGKDRQRGAPGEEVAGDGIPVRAAPAGGTGGLY